MPLADPPDPVRLLRHDIRGRLNAIRLCVGAAAFGTPRERAEFLEHVIEQADELVRLLDSYETAIVTDPAWSPPG